MELTDKELRMILIAGTAAARQMAEGGNPTKAWKTGVFMMSDAIMTEELLLDSYPDSVLADVRREIESYRTFMKTMQEAEEAKNATKD